MSIIVTMILSFCVSFAFMMSQRKPEMPARPLQSDVADSPPAAKLVPAPPAVQAPSIPQAPPAEPNVPKRLPMRAAVAAESDDSASYPPGSEMPVTLNIRNRGAKGIDAVIANNSTHGLYVTVEVVDSRTQQPSQIQLDLASGANRRFGLGDGMDMHAGDKITIYSPPYRNRTTVVQ